MNKLLPFERIMVEKMKALPVPDRADEIWEKIKSQIALPVPADEQKPGKGYNINLQSSSVKLTGIVLLLATVLLICYFLIFKEDPAPAEEREKELPVQIPQRPRVKQPATNPQHKQAVIPAGQSQKERNVISDSFHTISPAPQFSLQIPPPLTDTLKPLRVPVQIETPLSPPVKRLWGMKGISDSSYRLMGIKDSIK